MSKSYNYAFPRRETRESVRQSGDETLTCSTQCGWCKGISRGYVIKVLQNVTGHSVRLTKSSFTICTGFLDSPDSMVVVSDGVTLVFSVDVPGLKALLQQDSVRAQGPKGLSNTRPIVVS